MTFNLSDYVRICNAREELIDQKDAFKDAVSDVLKAFPEHKVEYERNGTILGRDLSTIFLSKNSSEFDENLAKIVNGRFENHTGFHGDLRAELESRGYKPDEVLAASLNTAYLRIKADLDARKYEYLVIGRTNRIIGEYFGEPARIGYEAASVSNARLPKPPIFVGDNITGYFDAVEQALTGDNGHLHSEILPGNDLAPTTMCPVIEGCDALTINASEILGGPDAKAAEPEPAPPKQQSAPLGPVLDWKADCPMTIVGLPPTDYFGIAACGVNVPWAPTPIVTSGITPEPITPEKTTSSTPSFSGPR